MTGLLSFPHWLLAWDSYCLAAAMLDQFPLSTGITYKHDVANIANDHGPRVAVMYDRLVRCSCVLFIIMLFIACWLSFSFAGSSWRI